MARNTVQEDETKNVLKARYFADYDWTRVIGKIDLCVRSRPELGALPVNYLWAETKQGKRKDIIESFIQLILTIGKGRIYEEEMPPYFLGAADSEKMAFVEYSKVMHIFSKNDFNWNVTPSDHGTKEFKELYALLHDGLTSDIQLFKYAFHDKELRSFIRLNFKPGRKDVRKLSVGKNNFTFVYFDWVRSVKDSIAVDWKAMEKAGILDCDFFLADLMSKDGMSIKDKLKVVLEKTKYKILRKVEADGLFSFSEISFKDGQKAYDQFWNRYERPPKPIYQRYILERRDLLVPQDIREIKGSYYTPEQWVRLSQEYLARALGEDWQEEYYVWDCAAGSGNLLRGLTNKYNIYASTLDDSDVKVMHDAIEGGRLNLVKSNVFQFDFLNDDFSHLPESLRQLVLDPARRGKLLLYLNPPYKEIAGTAVGVNRNAVHDRYADQLAVANRELFAQFLIRIYREIPSCTIGVFSTIKSLYGSSFSIFRQNFRPKLRSLFLVPAYTFDNVSGDFPIGFQVWDTKLVEEFRGVVAEVYDEDGNLIGEKSIVLPDKEQYFSQWIGQNKSKEGLLLGWFDGCTYNDFQKQHYLNIQNDKPMNNSQPRGAYIYDVNLMAMVCGFTVRYVIPADWLNNRDQFLVPNNGWLVDVEFQSDCLIYTLFHSQNRITSAVGVNHWIPYYEFEVNSPGSFNSRFMADFLHGKIKRKKPDAFGDLFTQMAVEETATLSPIDAMSDEAKSVLEAGRRIWCYYMSKPGVNVNASFLDIRAYFQGYKVTEKGKRIMNSSSQDDEYMRLWGELKQAVKVLEARIEPKVYEHGFLLK